MIDVKLWAEARDIAKDQMRHGKIHYSDFEKVTKTIYEDLLKMEDGPIIDVKPISSQNARGALPASSDSKFKHEFVNGKVRCSICGKLFKSISQNHLNTHSNMLREDYMTKFGLNDDQMQGTIERHVKTGDDNSLTILSYVMKEYNLKRAEAKPFVIEHGFTDLVDLMAQAKEKGISALELLKEKAPVPKKKAE